MKITSRQTINTPTVCVCVLFYFSWLCREKKNMRWLMTFMMVSFFWLKPNHITCCLCARRHNFFSFIQFLFVCCVVFFFAFFMHFGGQQQRNRISCMWIGSYYEISFALKMQRNSILKCAFFCICLCCCRFFFKKFQHGFSLNTSSIFKISCCAFVIRYTNDLRNRKSYRTHTFLH